MLPAVFLGGALVSGAFAGGYKVHRGINEALENRRYWHDYQRRTAVQVRYPYRAGYHYDYSKVFGGFYQGFQAGNYGYYGYQKGWWK